MTSTDPTDQPDPDARRRSPYGRHRGAAALALSLVVIAAACGSDGEARLTPGTGTNPAAGVEEQTPITRTGSLADLKVALEPVAEVDQPVGIVARPGTTDLFVVGQNGLLTRLARSDSAPGFSLVDPPALDLSGQISLGQERGFLGAAFSPDGARLYVYFTAPDGALTLDEYAMAGNSADPSSRRRVLSIPHPLPNHNGGQLGFGPDDLLYLGPGDGGGAGDPGEHGQNPETLLGTILRIDPTRQSDGSPYGIPDDNPFLGTGAPEVWSYGLRNPWRFSWDRATGDLWIADVGQNRVEEINWVSQADGGGRGANFGWNLMEGSQPFRDGAEPADHVPPLFDYARDDPNCAVTGGFVYRGEAIPELVGAYVYGDYCAAEIRALAQVDGVVTDERSLGISVAPNTLASFGEDAAGELYVVSTAGTIYRLVRA